MNIIASVLPPEVEEAEGGQGEETPGAADVPKKKRNTTGEALSSI